MGRRGEKVTGVESEEMGLEETEGDGKERGGQGKENGESREREGVDTPRFLTSHFTVLKIVGLFVVVIVQSSGTAASPKNDLNGQHISINQRRRKLLSESLVSWATRRTFPSIVRKPFKRDVDLAAEVLMSRCIIPKPDSRGCCDVFSERCNIYISRLCYDVSVHLSVRLSVCL